MKALVDSIRGRRIRFLLIFVGFIVRASLCSAEDQEAVAAATAAFRDRGMGKEAAAKLAKAFVRADELESVAPLLPLMEDPDLVVATTAAAGAIFVEPKAITAKVMKMLREKRGTPGALLIALSASNRRETVQFLITELAARRGEEREEAATMALRVLTQQSWATPAEWTAWWRDRGSKLKTLPFPKDQTEWEQRTFAASSLLRSDRLRTSLAKNPKMASNDASVRQLESAISGPLELLEKGSRMQLSAAAKEGDMAFAEGRIEDAVDAYTDAVKINSEDRRSAYLRACGLFELNRRTEAKKAFAALAAADPKAVGAEFLAQLCDVEKGHPLLPAARRALRTNVLYRGENPGWDDPILMDLLAQQMAGGGPHAIPQGALDELAANSPDDLILRSGIAQCRPRMIAFNAFAALREKFPDSPLPIAAWLEASASVGKKVESADLIEAAGQWRKLEPGNAVPALLELSFQNRRDHKLREPQPYDEATANAVIGALYLPDFETRGRELCQSIRSVFEVIEFPFPLAEMNNRPSFWQAMSDILWRLNDTAAACFETGDYAQSARMDDAGDLLAERLLAAGASQMAQMMYTSSATRALIQRRPRLIAAGAGGQALARLEGRILAFHGIGQFPVNAREVTFQMLFLPSLEREIVDEQLGVPYVDIPVADREPISPLPPK